MNRKHFQCSNSNYNAGAYFLNFFDEKFNAQYEGVDGFSALNLPGLDAEIARRIERDGWCVDEIEAANQKKAASPSLD